MIKSIISDLYVTIDAFFEKYHRKILRRGAATLPAIAAGTTDIAMPQGAPNPRSPIPSPLPKLAIKSNKR